MPTRRIKEEYRLPAIPVAGCPVRRPAAEHGPRPQTPSATNSGSCRLNGRKADSAPMQLTPSTPTVQYPPILCAEDPIASIPYPQPLSPYVPRASLLTWLPQLLTTIADCFFWGTLPSLVEDPHQLLPDPAHCFGLIWQAGTDRTHPQNAPFVVVATRNARFDSFKTG